METPVTLSEARTLLDGDHDAYGSARLYGVYGTSSPYAGQIAAVKSGIMLDGMIERDGLDTSSLYVVTRSGVPIRRA